MPTSATGEKSWARTGYTPVLYSVQTMVRYVVITRLHHVLCHVHRHAGDSYFWTINILSLQSRSLAIWWLWRWMQPLKGFRYGIMARRAPLDIGLLEGLALSLSLSLSSAWVCPAPHPSGVRFSLSISKQPWTVVNHSGSMLWTTAIPRFRSPLSSTPHPNVMPGCYCGSFGWFIFIRYSMTLCLSALA